MKPWIRSLMVAALLASVLLAGWLAAPPPRGAVARAAIGSNYEGTMSDGGMVSLTVGEDTCTPRYPGEPVCAVPYRFIDAYFVFSSVPTGCPIDAHVLRVPLNANDTSFEVQGEVMTRPRRNANGEWNELPSYTVSADGYWETFGLAAAGSLSVDPAPGEACPRRKVSWRAGLSDPGVSVRTSTEFNASGELYLSGTSTIVGSLEAATNDSGTAIASLRFEAQEGACLYSRQLRAPLWYDAGASFEYQAKNDWSVSGVAGVGFLGGGIVATGSGDCPALAVTYYARARQPGADREVQQVSPPEEVVAPPLLRGMFANSVAFDPETYTAESVFTGGTVDQLEAAGAVMSARSVQIRDSGGTWRVLVIGGGEGNPTRAAFRSYFPAGISEMTPVIITR